MKISSFLLLIIVQVSQAKELFISYTSDGESL